MNCDPAFVKALNHQARSCAQLGSDFMLQLLSLLANRLRPGSPVTDLLFNWAGDISPGGYSVPLRLAGALHRLVLSGQEPQLAAAYPPNAVDDETLWRAVSNALISHGDDIVIWLKSPPQTNEVRRAAALIAAGQYLAARFKLPMMISELGASAGLNLNWDRFRLNIKNHSFGPQGARVILTPDWTGAAPPAANVEVINRRGVDLLPIDTSNPAHRLRLLSYLWPDQPHRTALTNSAIAQPRAPVDQGDAIGWLAKRLPEQKINTLHLIYHTIAWQYFPAKARTVGRKLIERTGAKATRNKPLAWFSMEADRNGPGAGLTLRHWPGNHVIHLGRADFHGRWIDWQL